MAPHDAVLSFEYDDQRRARIVERSLRPEVDDLTDDRSRATVDREGATLTVRVEADDLVALRAALNTWGSLAETAETVADAGDRDAWSA
jgi:KEOPS complex subunit Pcc1